MMLTDNSPVTALAGGIVAAGICALTTPLVRRLSLRLRIVDEPGGRRIHSGSIPRLGGIAVFLAFQIVLGLLGRASVGPLALGALLVFLIGLLDDLRGVTPLPKIAVHFLAAWLALVADVRIHGITIPFTGALLPLGALGSVATLLWIMGLTNAFNLIDGLDGLASGVAIVASLTIALLAMMQGREDAAVVSIVLAGTLVGFLFHNAHPARIFLGDSGAYFIGFTVAVLAIQGLQKGPTLAVLTVPVLALGLPIVETLVTIQRRIRSVGPARVLESDRDHIHHRLLGGGLSHRQAILLLYGVTGAFGVLACLAVFIGGPGSAAAGVIMATACYFGLRRLGYL